MVTPVASGRQWVPSPGRLLAIVGGIYALAQFVLGPVGMRYGWDETIYVSQVAPHTPAAAFSPPRARGIVALVAPVAGLTTSTTAVRVYLVIISAVALVLAYRVWLRILGPTTVVLAAAIFASLWMTVVYGNEAMPNYWIALLAVGATGWTVRAMRDEGRPASLGLGLCVAGTALIRPGDAVWLTAPLILAMLVPHPTRHLRTIAVAVGSLALGLLPWVVEAEIVYGGVHERLLSALNATE